MTDTPVGSVEALVNPIINSPYGVPSRHFVLGPKGPTGAILEHRRPSESFIPVAPVRKGRKKGGENATQETLPLTHEQVVRNTLIDQLRSEVALWRARNYDGVTPTTRKLLLHWADPDRDNRVLFAQREAAETAIFLTEVSGRRTAYGVIRDWRGELADSNEEHNNGLPRVALKMATGSGKTVVMAMLIAWHTLNKIASPRDTRFVKRFLIVAPGVTIRDRLRVLQPNDPSNYYDLRDLVPSDLKGQLGKSQILIVNYHAFLLKDSREIKGVAKATRQVLLAGKKVDPFKETEDAMVSRVLRGWGVGSGKKQSDIVVLNDEAHHCYQDKPITIEGEEADAEANERNADARVWFKGLQAIARKVGVKSVYDLSATPFYLSGSGYKEGFIFPWVVSDFSLMDAIECGIVKIPRIPVDDDAAHEAVTYLNLWESIGKVLPKRGRRDLDASSWVPPDELVGALHSLYRSYERAFAHWETELKPLGETPPVFIVVCPNTAVSKLVHDWIAGWESTPGSLSLFSNVVDGKLLARPRTVLVDSAQLESGEAMKKDFKEAAAAEIEAFKAELRLRNPGADVDVTDEDLLREVMNTVGKKGRLGEQVRCVVSVAMLTEGWDANTVTHILGIRAFRSQLLCEQVVGRGLRRRSYDANENGFFEPEYASVYGVPFAFIPTDRPQVDPKPPRPTTLVRTVEGRSHLRITFPKLTGYRLEIPDAGLFLVDDVEPFVIGPGTIPTWTEAAPVVGESELIEDAPESQRPQTVAYWLAKRLLSTHFRTEGEAGDNRPWLFPELVGVCKDWIDRAVTVENGFDLGFLIRYVQWQARAADAVYAAVIRQEENRRARLRPILRPFDPIGSTENVSFNTRKVALVADPDRSEVSHVVLDGPEGNTWEQLLMAYSEKHRDVLAYVKNDHLGFEIPYVYEGTRHDYVPDFLVKLRTGPDEIDRTLIVEVSGGQKQIHAPGLTGMKRVAARDTWCVAVNNHGGFGRWGYLEITDPATAEPALDEAIRRLYADDGAIIGDPDRSDFEERTSVAAP
ncbi:DEAD/DEAH box helicase family protein [Streptomyces sp. NBC_01558]|uniref:BPTD_3080 family restriction endonuclease n=1 Tax=Streptomyces sp. NBC_01558 TaxID=2975878 RepID=UPI002DDB3509|nr:DEAD/DEAH box helicase family protein [Streptomyces sp. NBC_01558]WSD77571.1 DEAD/DEAH box helicase family protein [Streptomyces sp. NBC_01558]